MLFFRKNISKLTDEELLKNYCSSGEPEYFGELYNRYIPMLFGVCQKYLKDPERSEDAVMELFENLMHKINRYEVGNFRTWIYSVARNHCLNILRKEQKEIAVDFSTYVMESDEIVRLFDEDDPNEGRINALMDCLEKLPEHQRVSVTCFFLKEMSYSDIADATGYVLSKVKSYIQNGKRNLSICIQRKLK